MDEQNFSDGPVLQSKTRNEQENWEITLLSEFVVPEVNVLVTGHTGVGKRSLFNSIVGKTFLLNSGTLQITNMDHTTREDRFIAEWLKSSPNPTWSKLVKALRSPDINRPDIADEIEDKYIKSDDYICCTKAKSLQETKDGAGLTLEEVRFALRSVDDEWMNLGIALGLPYNTLQRKFEVTTGAGKMWSTKCFSASTDFDEDENHLLLLENMGVENAREIVPQMQRKDAEMKALVERSKEIRNQIGDLLVSMSGDRSIVVILPKFSQSFNDPTKKLFSQPLFLEKYRYKICLQVSMDGSGGNLSVFVHIMKGDFDSILDWPFVHKIAVKVKNQKEGDDIVHIVQQESKAIQKPEVDQNITFGSRNFPTYSELVTGGFVRDDSISIKCEVLWN